MTTEVVTSGVSTGWRTQKLKGFLQKGCMEINNNKNSAVTCGCLVSQVIHILQNVKISPLGQNNTVVASYPQKFSHNLCLLNRFINQIIVSSHSVTALSDIR